MGRRAQSPPRVGERLRLTIAEYGLVVSAKRGEAHHFSMAATSAAMSRDFGATRGIAPAMGALESMRTARMARGVAEESMERRR